MYVWCILSLRLGVDGSNVRDVRRRSTRRVEGEGDGEGEATKSLNIEVGLVTGGTLVVDTASNVLNGKVVAGLVGIRALLLRKPVKSAKLAHCSRKPLTPRWNLLAALGT